MGAGRTRGGIDLGGTKIQTVVVDAENEVLGEARRPTPQEGGPADVAAAMAEAMHAAASEAGLETGALVGVGVGSPGAIDAETGTVTSAKNLPGWDASFALGPELGRELGTEVRLGNDVDVATDAEFRLGVGSGHDSLLGVFWGTGVGGGLILDGKRWVGVGSAGEFGHMVIERDGAHCPCGRRGCVEAYAGRAAMEAKARHEHEKKGRKTDLFKLMRKHDRPKLTSGIWERAIDNGDELAIDLVDRAIDAIGTGLASALNLLDVEAVVIGGGMGVRFGDPYVERIVEAMMPHLFNDQRPPPVQVATLGDLGGAIGAALLVEGR